MRRCGAAARATPHKLTRAMHRSHGVPCGGDTYSNFDVTSWGQRRLLGKYNTNVTPACPANDAKDIFPAAVEKTVLDRVAAACKELEFCTERSPTRRARRRRGWARWCSCSAPTTRS